MWSQKSFSYAYQRFCHGGRMFKSSFSRAALLLLLLEEPQAFPDQMESVIPSAGPVCTTRPHSVGWPGTPLKQGVLVRSPNRGNLAPLVRPTVSNERSRKNIRTCQNVPADLYDTSKSKCGSEWLGSQMFILDITYFFPSYPFVQGE